MDQLEICELRRQEREALQASQINAMYKILVTGNGTPPLPEQVRVHAAWIAEQKAMQDEIRKANRNLKYTIIAAVALNIVTLVWTLVLG